MERRGGKVYALHTTPANQANDIMSEELSIHEGFWALHTS